MSSEGIKELPRHLSPEENLCLLAPSPGGSDQCPSSVLLSAFASR